MIILEKILMIILEKIITLFQFEIAFYKFGIIFSTEISSYCTVYLIHHLGSMCWQGRNSRGGMGGVIHPPISRKLASSGKRQQIVGPISANKKKIAT